MARTLQWLIWLTHVGFSECTESGGGIFHIILSFLIGGYLSTMTGYGEYCQYLTCALTCFQRYISQTNMAKSFPISGVSLHMADVKSWWCFNIVNMSQMDRDLGQKQNRRILKTIVANNMSSVGQRRENV